MRYIEAQDFTSKKTRISHRGSGQHSVNTALLGDQPYCLGVRNSEKNLITDQELHTTLTCKTAPDNVRAIPCLALSDTNSAGMGDIRCIGSR